MVIMRLFKASLIYDSQNVRISILYLFFIRNFTVAFDVTVSPDYYRLEMLIFLV